MGLMGRQSLKSSRGLNWKDLVKHFPTRSLSCDSIGSKVLSVSDEWFGPAKCLLKQDAVESLVGKFGPNGALYDGWESRRHNPKYDWVIIELGVPSGTIIGFDIDTTSFNGNEAPTASVYGLNRLDAPPLSELDPAWVELLPIVSLGPSSRHLFEIPKTKAAYRYLKLHMIPDGGIARFRVYGNPIPVYPDGIFDLASVLLGAQVVFTSDQHYGVGSNLILPGRGPNNMGGGWETKRSREPNHSDHAIIKLADKGYLDYVEFDTNYFIGNFPSEIPGTSTQWTKILAGEKLGPHQQQYFQLLEPGIVYTHVKMVIIPDGGVKRIRVMGSRFPIKQRFEIPKTRSTPQVKGTTFTKLNSQGVDPDSATRLPILPLTRAAFTSYGSVIEADSDSRVIPPSLNKKSVNFGTATKIESVVDIQNLNPKTQVPSLSIFSCKPWDAEVLADGICRWTLKGLERHPFSSQTFTPLMVHKSGEGGIDDELRDHGLYLIVVALDGNGKPDLKSLRAFVGKKSQGISYFANIWHAPLIAIKERMDFTSLMYETGDENSDCELIEVNEDSEIKIVCEMDKSVQELVEYYFK
ncbi:galactose-binding domain-like protein [Phakopsora pachyrhizi]|nr:galactose-binding domain-like protein [Phakopsora pachyrhizi]